MKAACREGLRAPLLSSTTPETSASTAFYRFNSDVALVVLDRWTQKWCGVVLFEVSRLAAHSRLSTSPTHTQAQCAHFEGESDWVGGALTLLASSLRANERREEDAPTKEKEMRRKRCATPVCAAATGFDLSLSSSPLLSSPLLSSPLLSSSLHPALPRCSHLASSHTSQVCAS